MSTEDSPLIIADIKPKMEFHGVVVRLELAGAFINIGLAQEAFLHISQIQGKKVTNVQDMLTVGQEITVWVQSVDADNQRIRLTMHKPTLVELKEVAEGQVFSGHVVRIEKFGAFVDFGAERPGLVHVSEMGEGYIESPESVVSKGKEVQVKVIRVNREKGQIDLSMNVVAETAPESAEVEEEVPTAMALALRKALDPAQPDSSSPEVPTKDLTSGKRRDRSQIDAILRRTLELHEKG